jgi:maleate isomerase
MLQADKWGDRARIGVLTPDIDVGPESEFWTMAPEGVSIHAARVPFRWRGEMQTTALGLDPVRAFVQPPRVDEAAEVLAAAPVKVIAFAFTSHSYVLGPDGDAELKERLERRTDGIPVLSACPSAIVALRALGVERLGLVDPPWFSAELDRLGAEYFHNHGFDVLYATHVELQRRQLNVRPSEVYEWLVARIPPAVEAVFIGGNGFRVVGAIHEMEQALGRPVITANQALFWHCLRLAGVEESLAHFGRIFTHKLPP